MEDKKNKKATAFTRAYEAHEGQRYGDLPTDPPYITHLITVAENLNRFGVATPDLEVAAYLHDAVEDTDMTLEQVRGEFGDTVAELVFAVTTEAGKNRKERNSRTYPKTAMVPGAVRLKLADRIANVENCWATQNSKLFMYQREYRAFRKALRNETDKPALAMWNHLDKLLGWWEKK